MPIHQSRDAAGWYFQWGQQKRYYYNPANKRSMMLAYYAAKLQGDAILAARTTWRAPHNWRAL